VSPSVPGRSGPIDWQAVRARMGRAEAALAEALDPSPERATAIMDARARALARVPAPPRRADTSLEVVLFALGRERYAIEARFVREVARLVDFTPVPGTPDFIVGVTNLRGDVLALVDLRRFFGVAPQDLTDQSRAIVLGRDRVEFAILADAAHGLTDLASDDLVPPAGEVSALGRSFLRGVTAEALLVLDGAALLAERRLTVGGQPAPDK